MASEKIDELCKCSQHACVQAFIRGFDALHPLDRMEVCEEVAAFLDGYRALEAKRKRQVGSLREAIATIFGAAQGEPTVVSKATGDTLAATIMIKHFKDGTAQLWTHDGKRPLGKRTTLAKAQAQEAAIKARQAAEGKKG